MTDFTELPQNIAYGMEQFMQDWHSIPWHEVPVGMQQFRDEEGPIGAGKHPEFGWFVCCSGQGPLLLWCETPPEKLLKEFRDYRPLGGRTPGREEYKGVITNEETT